MAVKRILSSFARLAIFPIALIALIAQGPPAQTILLMQPPLKPALDEVDARRVLESQRLTEYNRAEMYHTQEGRRYLDATDAQQRLYLDMAKKYHCEGCDLGWDMQWRPPAGSAFAEVKPDAKKPADPVPGK